MVCKRIHIEGRVLKTGLRYFLKDKATILKISGRTFYLSDNSLFIIALGESDRMDKFVAFCKAGNPYSFIIHVEIINQPLFNYTSFEVVDEFIMPM